MNKTDFQNHAVQSDAVDVSSDLQRGSALKTSSFAVHHDQAASPQHMSGLTLQKHDSFNLGGTELRPAVDSRTPCSRSPMVFEPNKTPNKTQAPVTSSLSLESLATLAPLENKKPINSAVDTRTQSSSNRKDLITAGPTGHVPMLHMTTEELSADLKKIYGNLANIEAKCITIDAAQAAEPRAPLTNEQWQTLIALHRTLLYDHHDFIMVSAIRMRP